MCVFVTLADTDSANRLANESGSAVETYGKRRKRSMFYFARI